MGVTSCKLWEIVWVAYGDIITSVHVFLENDSGNPGKEHLRVTDAWRKLGKLNIICHQKHKWLDLPHLLFKLLKVYDTADPKIMPFHSNLFDYNVDEKKKIDSQLGPLSVWSFHVFPMSGGFSPGTPVPLHIPKMCTWGQLVCLHCPSLSVGASMSAPWREEHPVWGGESPWAPSCRNRLLPAATLQKNSLTCF